MCRLIRTLMEGLPVDISECHDGAQALAVCAEMRPDCVVLDLNLSGMDTFAATRQIRAADPNVRILLLGEDDDARLRELALGAGAWEYLAKQNLLEVPALLAPLVRDGPNHKEREC